MDIQEVRFVATESRGEVSGLLVRPRAACALLVLAHGAGAGMEHPFMSSIAEALGDLGIATLRYRFPYVEAGRKSPDPGAVLEATTRSAVTFAARLVPALPRFAGGKSMGGRMTSRAAATGAGLDARGIVFFGFPLHASGRPGVERAEHLADVRQPMLFLQGTRDVLARLESMRAVCAALGERATLHVVEGADHGFHVLKRSGRDDAAVIEELAEVTRAWIEKQLGLRRPRVPDRASRHPSDAVPSPSPGGGSLSICKGGRSVSSKSTQELYPSGSGDRNIRSKGHSGVSWGQAPSLRGD